MASFVSFLRSSFMVLIIFSLGSISAVPLDELVFEIHCPRSLSKIKSIVQKAIREDRRMGASLLRLHFHDCFVNGCDASVLLDNTTSTNGEKFALPNINSLRGFEVIDNIKYALEKMCPQKVSCADILAVAARDSVKALGMPSRYTWGVKYGRKDSLTANINLANRGLPPFFFDLNLIVSFFQTKGFTVDETVVLSGGHTVGKARCPTFRDRAFNKTSIIERKYAKKLQGICRRTNSNNLADLDDPARRIDLFDNRYFKKLIAKRGLLHSDQQLYSGNKTVDAIVKRYAKNKGIFFTDFAKAMVKMGDLSSGAPGEIRKNCRKINAR